MATPLTVLVVDDDAAPRDLAATFLRAMGYSVILAADGKSALQAAKAHKGDLHLVLTDVIMPGLNGPQVVEALRKTRPGLRAAYMSGYGDDLLAQQGIDLEGVILVPKPFTSQELASWVRAALERPTKTRA
ncbi:MAG TPA: response regulator [Planctomycetota bacterium]|nr:response regulator [Planctomycetota bacterium]